MHLFFIIFVLFHLSEEAQPFVILAHCEILDTSYYYHGKIILVIKVGMTEFCKLYSYCIIHV
jgi:hypothetical protein